MNFTGTILSKRISMALPLQERPFPSLVFLGGAVGSTAAFFAGIAKREWEEQSTRINKVAIGMILGYASGGISGALVGAMRHAFCRRRNTLFDLGTLFSPTVVSQAATVFLSFTAGVGFVQLLK
jgi:hypothetical protein